MWLGVTLFILFAFSLGSIAYVYKWRGITRYDKFGEYIRKGWPIFSPLNCLLYIFTQPRARKSIINLEDFKDLDPLKNNWRTIKEEVIGLHNEQYFEQTKKPDSKACYDIGFRTFFKYGWSKFYLKWYGYTHDSAKKLCPKTLEILEKIPSINGAMFSVLPAGSKLTRHLDPVACSLRYHLGLVTPNSDDCFINVDGSNYSWRDGEGFLFDETYVHYARNDTKDLRLILMCDVDRPTNWFGRIINSIIKILMRLTIVPNVDGDKCGFVNKLFSGLGPILQKTQALKQTNKKLYLMIKYTVNFSLFIFAFGIIVGLLSLAKQLTLVAFS